MLSQMFLADWRKMRAQGLDPEPADVIRLNALAIHAKRAAQPFSAAHLPRVVFLDGFSLREPTIAHELWVDRVFEYIDQGVNLNFRAVYAYALSRKANDLPDPLNRRRVISRVFDFAKRRAFQLTSDALADAIDYVLFGSDWTIGEFPPETASRQPSATSHDPHSPAVGILLGSVARRLPLSLSEAKGMTPSELQEITLRVELEDHPERGEYLKTEAKANYYRARNEVIERLKKEKECPETKSI